MAHTALTDSCLRRLCELQCKIRRTAQEHKTDKSRDAKWCAHLLLPISFCCTICLRITNKPNFPLSCSTKLTMTVLRKPVLQTRLQAIFFAMLYSLHGGHWSQQLLPQLSSKPALPPTQRLHMADKSIGVRLDQHSEQRIAGATGQPTQSAQGHRKRRCFRKLF